MESPNRPVLDSTPILLVNGYAWLPGLIRRAPGGVARARLMGGPVVALHGPEAVSFFYDERHIRRGGALPEPVQGTLFGKGGVQGLDGEAHRKRKAMFMSVLTDPDAVAALIGHVTAAWEEAAAGWADRPEIVLFDEIAEIITRGCCRWAGIPLTEDRPMNPIRPVARDRPTVADRSAALTRELLATVDGFATAGPRHLRARRARGRLETWLARLVEDVRDGAAAVPPGSPAETIVRHRDADGRELEPHVAAVEVLNVVRPTVAVSWYIAFAAHALHLWPGHRDRLRGGDPAYAAAFAQEVRRFYPFTPFVGGQAVTELSWRGETIPAGAMVLLDVYGQDHDASLWDEPYAFRPERFLGGTPGRDEFIPQGGGDPRTGHRCPGEDVTVALLQALSVCLARLEYRVPPQDLTVSLRRIPTRPRSGVIIADVRMDGREPGSQERTDERLDEPSRRG